MKISPSTRRAQPSRCSGADELSQPRERPRQAACAVGLDRPLPVGSAAACDGGGALGYVVKAVASSGTKDTVIGRGGDEGLEPGLEQRQGADSTGGWERSELQTVGAAEEEIGFHKKALFAGVESVWREGSRVG
ncbi:unnamed protein product [Lampetra planeri]